MNGKTSENLIHLLIVKRLSPENIGHFLAIELFDITLKDRIKIYALKEQGHSEGESRKLVLSDKEKQLYIDVKNGSFDRRFEHYFRPRHESGRENYLYTPTVM
ncbi:hypothetical protein [Vibrio hepatarius]|uniref:hypothetical protein n=1 Tax=Vibrio hepatarius TaxID=171383 RepID=UPI003735B567